jgi:hypothetical protein
MIERQMTTFPFVSDFDIVEHGVELLSPRLLLHSIE